MASSHWQQSSGGSSVILATSADFDSWYGTIRKSKAFSTSGKATPARAPVSGGFEFEETPYVLTAKEAEEVRKIKNTDFSKLGLHIPVQRGVGTPSVEPCTSSIKFPGTTPQQREYLRRDLIERPPTYPNVRVERKDRDNLHYIKISFSLADNKSPRRRTDAILDTGAPDMWIPLEWVPEARDPKHLAGSGFPFEAYLHHTEFRIVGTSEVFMVNTVYTSAANFPEGKGVAVIGQRGFWDSLQYVWIGYRLNEDGKDNLVLMKYKPTDGTGEIRDIKYGLSD